MSKYAAVARPGAIARFIVDCDQPDSDTHIPRADVRDILARTSAATSASSSQGSDYSRHQLLRLVFA